ncbi:MAG: phosphoribosylformylglycinamidine synthase subunit PurL [Acidobacteria bacterium]|nr:phosphoribosylformylglycinamidine synthase subunit PurL [Acidobacteriota bacterium]MBI3658767.1 phosphoribosylformylglycinamidine synthase subunit PurL [Acidobacteriota bacterium]
MSATSELVKQHGLSDEEYRRIIHLLGREPNLLELGIFSVMWSEHCSYKSSRAHLKKLPTQGACVLQGPGENAGVVSLGDDLAIVFKIESHNHPSYIEPYQGAATGVGGIIRDIFTMGARPIALMDALHFGPLDKPKNRSLMEGVVAGVGGYGNAIGIPTVGGETIFAEGYSKNPIINVFCLGLAKRDQLFFGRAEGIGNPVIYVGAKTGRDGIHGATMASAEFSEAIHEKRPNVQIGDPFLEKLLLEACLEAMQAGLIVGIQDMGAAGLTSSSCEMGARSGTGVEIELSRVPQRETGMTPYEIMLSESQERMLLVAERGQEEAIVKVFRKWDLDAVVIGNVTDDGLLRLRHQGSTVAEIPNRALTNEAPVYQRPMRRPDYLTAANSPAEEGVILPVDFNAALQRLLGAYNLSDKRWVYEQYDYMVRTNTMAPPGGDAAVLRIKETDRAIAMSLDGNPRHCYLNPRLGAMQAVAESARNVVCAGATPLAITNCLNFGNPENPDVMWQFSETVDGLAEACRAFNTPVTGGNVSFYNETLGHGIYPTPVIGMVGMIERLSFVTTPWFKDEGDVILLLGENTEELGGSEYLATLYDIKLGPLPRLSLERELAVQKACMAAIRSGVVKSAHDVSEGGLAVALAECCFSGGRQPIGCEIRLIENTRPDAVLFGEAPSRIVLSIREADAQGLREIAARHKAPLTEIGRVGGEDFKICINQALIIARPIAQLKESWENPLPQSVQVAKS